jgi:hypothetical protein
LMPTSRGLLVSLMSFLLVAAKCADYSLLGHRERQNVG